MCGFLLGTWPATQACALTGHRTGDSLVHKSELNPLNYTSQGQSWDLEFLSRPQDGKGAEECLGPILAHSELCFFCLLIT